MRKLVAAIACRNKGSRMYGKPLQNLNITNEITILDNIIGCLKSIKIIDSIVLGISEGIENDTYVDYAIKNQLKYIRGDEVDVLGRLVQCGEYENSTDIFRITSESPFCFFDMINQSWAHHVEYNNDATLLDEIIDGCGFEIISLEALQKSHRDGNDKHRSELCTLFIRENKDKFKIEYITPPIELIRKDIRLTVDNPEDLIVCRAVYENFKHLAPKIPVLDIVSYLDNNIELLKLTSPFCEEGYRTMYL